VVALEASGRRAALAALSLAAGFAIAVAIHRAASWVALRLTGAGPAGGAVLDEAFYLTGAVVVLTLHGALTAAYLAFLASPRRRGRGPRGGKLPRVTVVIPAYNEADSIGDTIRSVLASDYPRDRLEVLVVDDGSTDGTAAAAAEAGARVVRHERNMGRGAAVETGIRHARGEIVVTVDADTTVEPDAIRLLVEALASTPRAGAACGRLRPRVGGGVVGRGQRAEYAIGFAYSKLVKSLLGWMLIPCGAFSAYKRSVVAEARVADTLAEDFDLGLHVIERGLRLVYEPAAVAYTDAPKTLGQLVRQRVRWTIGGLQAMAKHHKLMANPKVGTVGLAALPLHFTIGYAAPLLEATGLAMLATLTLAASPREALLLASWLAALRALSLALLAPGALYARLKLREPITFLDLAAYWLAYYYILLYAGLAGFTLYLSAPHAGWRDLSREPRKTAPVGPRWEDIKGPAAPQPHGPRRPAPGGHSLHRRLPGATSHPSQGWHTLPGLDGP